MRSARPAGSSLGEGELHDVQGHARSRLSLLGGVVMDLFVLEAVPEVGVERKEYNQPSVANNAEGLRRAAVVLMNLRQSGGEVVKLVKNRMGERQFDERRRPGTPASSPAAGTARCRSRRPPTGSRRSSGSAAGSRPRPG